MLLKVVSVNVWHGGRLMENLIEFLKAQAPDLVFVQEALGGTDPALEPRMRTMPVIAGAVGLGHYDFAPTVNWTAQGGPDLGNGVFSKFPIASREVAFFHGEYRLVEGDDPKVWVDLPRAVQHLTLETPAGPVHALNVHGPWDVVGERDSPLRRRMVSTILRLAGAKKRVIVAGDTNAKQENPVWQAMDGRLVSVFGPERKTSFNLRRKDLKESPGYATAVVDMMFVSPDVRVFEHACPDVDVSDHLPLVANLEV